MINFGPGIFRKTLAIVLLPLAIQACFLIFIAQQLGTTKEITDRERRIGDITLMVNLCKQDVARGMVAQSIYLINRSAKYHRIAEQNALDVEHDMKVMQDLAEGDDRWKNIVDKGAKTALQILETLRSLQPGDRNAGAVIIKLCELEDSNPEARDQRDQVLYLYKTDMSGLKEEQLKQSQSAQIIWQLIFWSVIADIFLALALLLWFSKDITKRLNYLVENATALGEIRTLPHTLSGTDEIAYFDRTLHEAQNQLSEASRLRLELMSDMARRMRLPLAETQTCLDELDTGKSKTLEAKTQKHLHNAQKNIGFVVELLNDLLTIENLAAGSVDLNKSKCTVREIAEEAVGTLQSLASQKNVQLVNECREDEIFADKAKIVQVLINYVANGVKYSPGGKTVTLKSNERHGRVRISVTDEGAGIDISTQEQIFDPFFQANTGQPAQAAGSGQSQGFGLGLAICKLIVECHGGVVGVQSQPQQGSTFWLEMPKAMGIENELCS